MSDEQDSKRLVAKMDNSIKELDDDISLLPSSSKQVSSRLSELRHQANEKYVNATKRIILGDEQGAVELNDLIIYVSEQRVYLLSKALDHEIEKLSEKIKNPFWLKEQATYIDALENIKKEITKFSSELTNNPEHAKSLRNLFSKLSELSTKVERERQRAQYNIPFQILIWGIPILVGFYISDKFTLTQNLIFTGILILVSVISFFLVRFWDLDKPRIALEKFAKKIAKNKFLSLFGMVNFDGEIKWAQITILGIYLIGVAIYFGGAFLINSSHTNPMKLTLGSLSTPILQGSQIELPYSVSYDGRHSIFDVQISVDAPGLIANNLPISYPAIGKQPQEGKISFDIPPSIPNGTYVITVICDFKSVREKFPLSLLQSSTSYNIKKSIEIVVGK